MCPASLRNLPASVFYFPSPRNTNACHHACFLFCLMWALWLKLRLLCVQGKYFNHWAISRTLSLSLEMTWFSLRVPKSLGGQLRVKVDNVAPEGRHRMGKTGFPGKSHRELSEVSPNQAQPEVSDDPNCSMNPTPK